MLTTIAFLIVCLLPASPAQILYKCNFEEPCGAFVFDSNWIVKNVSSHIDHTYGNLCGHYITYINNSVSQTLATFVTQQFIEASMNQTVGDDLQSRISAGSIGTRFFGTEWLRMDFQPQYAPSHFHLYILFTSITRSVNIDDISVSLGSSLIPTPPPPTVFNCDFDKTVCSQLFSFSNYAYSWSTIQAKNAQNYTAEAPGVDYLIGDQTGSSKNHTH
ncbi:unnamed protein product [Rotaria sp. Silwood1]|nr:unnamed protein product [Rotaria sp. Silwood1]